MPTATSYGDSLLTGMGSYSLTFKYWWHIPVPEEVQHHTLLHKKKNLDGRLISINVLEFEMVIINYIAALHVVTTSNMTHNPSNASKCQGQCISVKLDIKYLPKIKNRSTSSLFLLFIADKFASGY